MSDVLVIGSLKPKDHCCYDICGAVIHVETNPGLYGYGNTLDLLHDSVRKYLPTKDKTGSDDSFSKVVLNSIPYIIFIKFNVQCIILCIFTL